MDILKTLIGVVPEAHLVFRMGFFLVGTSLLGWYSFFFTPQERVNYVQSKERKEAIAGYLGWNSKTLLVPGWESRDQVMPAMDAFLEALEIELERPTAYFLANPEDDGGGRAQRYSEIVFAKLMAKHSREVANYFGVASNLILGVSRNQHGPVSYENRIALQETISIIDLPEDLRAVPDADLLKWMNQINEHFEKRL